MRSTHAKISLLLCAVLVACLGTPESPALSPNSSPLRTRAERLVRRSEELGKTGKIAEGTPLLQEALGLYQEIEDSQWSAEVSYLLAMNQTYLRRPDDARHYFQQAAELRQQREEILRWALDSALAAVTRTHEGHFDPILIHFNDLHDTLLALRSNGGSVRVSGLERHANVFPPELSAIIRASQPERLPADGLGGLAINVVEAALLDMEIDFHIERDHSVTARERIHSLERMAKAGAGAYFEMLAAFASCRLSHREGQAPEALTRCEKAAVLFEQLPPSLDEKDSGRAALFVQIHQEIVDLHEELGYFAEATQLQSSIDLRSAALDPCSRGKLGTSQAVTMIRLGQFQDAKELLEQARSRMACMAGCGGLEAQVVSLLATVEVALGEVGSAQGHAEKAIQLAKSTADPRVQARAWVARLNVDLWLGDMDRASHSLYQIRKLDPGSEVAREAQFRYQILETLHGKGIEQAQTTWRELLRANPGLGSSSRQYKLGLTLLHEIAEASSWASLETRLLELLPSIHHRDSLLEESQLLSLLAVAAFADGRLTTAADYLTSALPLFEEGGLHPGLLLAMAGQIGVEHGHSGEAEANLSRARILLESILETLRSDASRLRFSEDGFQSVYQLLVEVSVDSGKTDDAFEVTEAARQRALLQALSTPSPPVNSAEGTSPPTQTARAEEASKNDRRKGSDRERLLIDQARAQEATPTADRRIGATPATLEDAQAAAGRTGSLVSFFTTQTRLFAWVVQPDRVEFRELGSLNDLLDDIDCLNLWTRSALGPPRGVAIASPMVSTDCHPIQSAEHLYDALIGPLRSLLPSEPLVLVPHGQLQSIAFAALRDPKSGRFLIEDFALSYLPSVSVLIATRENMPSARGRTLVVGDPETGTMDRLGFARIQAQYVAEMFDTEPILGRDATESRLRWELSKGDVEHLMFAGHGAFDHREWAFSSLYLAKKDGGAHDGVLEAHEIAAELRLPITQLVTLSGCETGLGALTKGDESLGLVRAFLIAGSRRVLATRWLVNDQATATLMTDFYAKVAAGLSPARALQQAQIALLRQKVTAPPYYWAAFMLVGDPAPWPVPLPTGR